MGINVNKCCYMLLHVIKYEKIMNMKILDLIEERLIIGERKYGNENVINDGRDFVQEALEEALDCAVYLAAKLIELKNKRKEESEWEEQ